MKICDICGKQVDVLYPISLFMRGGDGDICPNCANNLIKEKKDA